MNRLALFLLASALLAACNNPGKDAGTPSGTKTTDNYPDTINFAVIKAYPHDTSAYTEGFLFHNEIGRAHV